MCKEFTQKLNRKKAFTLMEVLVASAIFAIVMVVTTGTVSQASQYNTKLKNMRKTSMEARKFADMITQDIRSADSSISIDNKFNYGYTDSLCVNDPLVPGTTTFKNGLTNLAWRDGNYCIGYESQELLNPNDDDTDLWNNQILVISSGDEYILYGTGVLDGVSSIFYQKIPNVSSGNPVTLVQSDFDQLFASANRISDVKHDVTIGFGGYMPMDDVAGQSIVRFSIVDEMKGNDTLPAGQRARAEIRSAVTSRSYN